MFKKGQLVRSTRTGWAHVAAQNTLSLLAKGVCLSSLVEANAFNVATVRSLNLLEFISSITEVKK